MPDVLKVLQLSMGRSWGEHDFQVVDVTVGSMLTGLTYTRNIIFDGVVLSKKP